MISIICSLYKSDKYLSVFFNELTNQEYFSNFEFLFDLNEPSNLEIDLVNKFSSNYKNVKFFTNNEVIPLPASWNKMIKFSSNEKIAIWNVDDLRVSSSLRIQLDSMNKGNYYFSYGNFVVVNQFNSKSGQLINKENCSKHDLVTGMHLGPFFMFEKSICKSIGYFDEQLISGADFDFAIRMALNYKGVFTNNILGYYLIEGNGLSTKQKNLQYIESQLIYLRYGVWNKFDLFELKNLIDKYSVSHILNYNKWVALSDRRNNIVKFSLINLILSFRFLNLVIKYTYKKILSYIQIRL